ncbi:uncharacterized protein Tco_1238939 [Tanacetum coccineum]
MAVTVAVAVAKFEGFDNDGSVLAFIMTLRRTNSEPKACHATPLTKLTRKSEVFTWTEKQENAFQRLKDCLCKAPILSLPEGNEDFVVYSDASYSGLGCVLMQRGKVIAYA